MMVATGPRVEVYWNNLSRLLPDFTPEQQQVAVAVYRELAKGEAVSASQIAAVLDGSGVKTLDLLDQDPLRRFVYRDEKERIAGFGGLATAPMHHEFHVNGQKLWTWCAWDSLFLPIVLAETAEVQSPDPETSEVVRLRVSPTGIQVAEPKSTVVSFLFPDAAAFDQSAANVMAKFCHYVFLFASRKSAELWTTKHEGTFLYSVDEAFELGQRLVMKQFSHELRLQSGARPRRI